ncbi:MAG: aldehyde dehydrogenase (NADP(+)) [Planctomycetota bacterium]|nr:aldehyde dehydrogenase (NADP(+)) [Planctomycetota bacterium]MDA1211741.1 aldehyde dehydrogenase (NADP(+)) [Planctomycetota bacterium]
MSAHPVLIDGQWRASTGTTVFQALNPKTEQVLPDQYPVSPWAEIEQALDAASAAFRRTAGWHGVRFAQFLECFADKIEGRTDDLVEIAHQETALPVSPRLKEGELPRTTNQLRQAAAAAREGSWSLPTIDTKANIRSYLGPIGPVAVFGPNNFPFAFNSSAGGDFAAAIAAGNPVIAKGHTSHPSTTRLFAELALDAVRETDLPPAWVQLIYRTSHDDGAKLVSHPLIGASGYTGSRHAGLTLKTAADAVGKPMYLELSSINPIFILPGALSERLEAIADEFSGSCLMGTGQFCTNPGLVFLPGGPSSEAFVDAVAKRFQAAAVGTMLSSGVQKNFLDAVNSLQACGAKLITGGTAGGGTGVSCTNTLLTVDGDAFMANPEALQAEAFGNGSLFVIASNPDQLPLLAERLEGNLTGTLYTATDGGDDALYEKLEAPVRQKVGRLLNDKMPTGVAVSPAMNHGGPFPATGHSGFTAVGIPASLRRFGMLQCYDGIRPHRLPMILQNAATESKTWRLIDGVWTQGGI